MGTPIQVGPNLVFHVQQQYLNTSDLNSQHLSDPKILKWHDLIPPHHSTPQSIAARIPASDNTRSRAAFAAAIVVSASRLTSGSSASILARPAAASSALGVQ